MVILLNFLIAVISQGYDLVIAQSVAEYFRSKTQLNNEMIMIIPKKTISGIILVSSEYEKGIQKVDDNMGFVRSISDHVTKEIRKHQRNVHEMNRN